MNLETTTKATTTATKNSTEDTTMSTMQVTHDPIDLKEIGRRGNAAIRFKVPGFWSDSCVEVRVNREIDWQRCTGDEWADKGTWTARPSHSSGGREPAEVADDIEAAEYFAAGVLESISVARFILANVEELESHYQERQAEELAARQRAQEEYDAAVAADMPLGVSRAKALLSIAAVRAEADHRDGIAFIKTVPRGRMDPGPTISAAFSFKTYRVTHRINGTRVALKQAIEKLAGMSSVTWDENETLRAEPAAEQE